MVKIYVDLACPRPGKKVRNCSACQCLCVCVYVYFFVRVIICLFFFSLFLTAVAHP